MPRDDIPTTMVPASARSGGQGDPRADDWLADEGTMEWFPVAEDGLHEGGAQRRPRRRQAAAGLPGDLEDDLYRRRRLVGLAAIVVLVAVAAILAVALSGGGGTKTPPTTAAQTTTTTRAQTTPTTPAGTKKSSGHTAAALHLVLDQAGRYGQRGQDAPAGARQARSDRGEGRRRVRAAHEDCRDRVPAGERPHGRRDRRRQDRREDQRPARRADQRLTRRPCSRLSLDGDGGPVSGTPVGDLRQVLYPILSEACLGSLGAVWPRWRARASGHARTGLRVTRGSAGRRVDLL
jgi:hypothetical protein